MARARRRAKRTADVDYDRTADVPLQSADTTSDDERVVELDDNAPELLSDREFYEHERPPHHGE
ncbi:hypothetical protein CGLAU_03795 [Corynebacterium glaucum]|uniref:Uncharacterized protein n=1 Tax=Corynebacterium glaucum TaxID=187491 RepID=A0A1Q2HV59_9CORY|nr:hypothetical protein [Corynebacterium glaucum]AQQ14736.1 hypothetical protein CGLAU_03795 [Corynebacterium glaucum]WJZ07244.1 hypothetical protein CGLAUT_03715 [Corynebacterium glaucum]